MKGADEGSSANEENQEQSAVGGGSGKDAGRFSLGQSSAPKDGTPPDTSSQGQRRRGPRPTSEQRTVQKDGKTHNQSLRPVSLGGHLLTEQFKQLNEQLE